MCLFSRNTNALIHLHSRATPDRAPEHLAAGTPAAMRDDLISPLGASAVLSRVTDLVKYATDASPYRLFPQAVVAAQSPELIAEAQQYAYQNHHAASFRLEPERPVLGRRHSDRRSQIPRGLRGIGKRDLRENQAGHDRRRCQSCVTALQSVLVPDPASSAIALSVASSRIRCCCHQAPFSIPQTVGAKRFDSFALARVHRAGGG
jgi:hypothetical protein